jgi:hypothetical protein
MLALHHEFLFIAIPSGGVEKASGDNSDPPIFKPPLLDVFVDLRNFDLFGLEVMGIVDDEAVLEGKADGSAVEMHFLHRDRGRGCVVGGASGVGCVAHTRTLE